MDSKEQNNILDNLSSHQKEQVDTIIDGINEKVFGDPDNPHIFFDNLYKAPDGLSLEENLRYCGEKVEEAAQKATHLIDSSTELKNIFKEDYETFKKTLVSGFKVSGIELILPMPGTMPSWIMQYVFEKCENSTEGKTREEVKKSIDCAIDELSKLLCEEVKEIGLNEMLLNMVHGPVYDPNIDDEELNEFLGIDTKLFFYTKEIPYKQGISLQTAVDEIFEEHKDYFHGLKKDAIKECLEKGIAKNTKLTLDSDMIRRIEEEPSDTLIPIAWAAEQLKKHFVISENDAEYIRSSISWTREVDFHTSTGLLERITYILTEVYRMECPPENEFHEITQERFEELINGQGKSKISNRDNYTGHFLWANFLEVKTDEERENYINGLKEIIYSRLDKGNKINFGSEIELERNGNNIKIRPIENDVF